MEVRKNEIFEARQWFCDGDHPLVGRRHAGISNPDVLCTECGKPRKYHGFLPFNFPVCQGDWLVNDGHAIGGEYLWNRYTDIEFKSLFEKI